MAAVLTIQERFTREITKLSLWYVRRLVSSGEVTADGISEALTKRVDLYRRTSLFDGTNHPAFGYRDAHWDALTMQLAPSIAASPADDTVAMEEAGLAILWPSMLARLDTAPAEKPPRPFGCFSYDLDWEGIGDRPSRLGALFNATHLVHRIRKSVGLAEPPKKDATIHFENAVAPLSPFEDMAARAASLLALLNDCRTRHPSVRQIWCSSWLNSHPAFQSLFPPEWKASGVINPPGFYRNWWGQFVTKTGDFNDDAAARFRSSGGHFPYTALLCHASLPDIIRHLESTSFS